MKIMENRLILQEVGVGDTEGGVARRKEQVERKGSCSRESECLRQLRSP